MAGADRMTIEEVVRKVLLDEHADVIREAVKAVAAELMELEVSELIGAKHGGGAPTRMTLPVPARSFVTPMRRGRLPVWWDEPPLSAPRHPARRGRTG